MSTLKEKLREIVLSTKYIDKRTSYKERGGGDNKKGFSPVDF